MVFYGLDGRLGGVHTMIVWLDELDADLLFFDDFCMAFGHSLSMACRLGDKFLARIYE